MARAGTPDDPTGPQRPPAERRQRGGGWLARIAPGVRKIVGRRDTPENLWVKDPDTGEMIYRPELEAALWVTPSGKHLRINAEQRLSVERRERTKVEERRCRLRTRRKTR